MRLSRRDKNSNNEPEGGPGSPEEPLEARITTDVVDADGETITTVTTYDVDPEVERASKTRINRTVWVMAIIAVLSLGAGILVSRFIISPAQAAADAEAPPAGPITVPVEQRELSSDVRARGDAVYDDAVELSVDTTSLTGPAIVTGRIPDLGAEVNPASVLLEVSGRPIIAIPGELPSYRTLVPGAKGPDVEQLQTSLTEMGFEPGGSGTYDAQTASAVEALYTEVGYPAPEPAEGSDEAVRAAEDQVQAAEDSLTQAQNALDLVAAGPSQSERLSYNSAVNDAQRALDAAIACDPADMGECPSVASARDQLAIAQAQRDEALSVNTSAEVAARDAAQEALNDANEDLAEARTDVLTPLPASEVAYFANLPRRVDTVAVKVGDTITTSVMTISGATLEIVASVDDADASLLEVGQAAVLSFDDLEIPASVTELNAEATRGDAAESTTSSDRTEVVLLPDELTEEQRSQIAGANLLVTIPVESTGGEVLAVPVASLTAGPGGETRVSVLRDPEEPTELVTVTTGLVAEGYVEIVSAEPALEVGDLVVVGEVGAAKDEDEEAANDESS